MRRPSLTTLYLAFNAVLYLTLGAWCALEPVTTADFVGLAPTGPAGRSEYLAVYGGLELGLGAFYAIATFASQYRRAAVVLSVLLYAGIAALRTVAALDAPYTALGNARWFHATEIVLFVVAALLLVRGRERDQSAGRA